LPSLAAASSGGGQQSDLRQGNNRGVAKFSFIPSAVSSLILIHRAAEHHGFEEDRWPIPEEIVVYAEKHRGYFGPFDFGKRHSYIGF
jgi:hypothetical protein